MFTELWLGRRRFSVWQKTDKIRRTWIRRAILLAENEIYDEARLVEAVSCDPAGVSIGEGGRKRYVACCLRFCPFCHARLRTKVLFDRLAELLRQRGELSLVRFELTTPYEAYQEFGEACYYPPLGETQASILGLKAKLPRDMLEGASVCIGFRTSDKKTGAIEMVARVLATKAERGRLFEDDTKIYTHKVRKIEDLVGPVALATPYPRLFLNSDLLFAKSIQDFQEKMRLFFRYGTFRDAG